MNDKVKEMLWKGVEDLTLGPDARTWRGRGGRGGCQRSVRWPGARLLAFLPKVLGWLPVMFPICLLDWSGNKNLGWSGTAIEKKTWVQFTQLLGYQCHLKQCRIWTWMNVWHVFCVYEDEKSLEVEVEQVVRSWGKMWIRKVLASVKKVTYMLHIALLTCRTICSKLW